MSNRSRTPFTILGCLTMEPMSGYDIKRFLEETVSQFWNESYGQLYPALRTLEGEGLIQGRAEPGERGREKRVYRITEAGREQLRAWLQEPAQPVQARYEHSLKIFFGHNVGAEVSLRHVERLRRQTEEDLARYRSWEAQLGEWAEREPHSPAAYLLVVLRGGVLYSEMVLRWCDESAAALGRLQQTGAGDAPKRAASTGQEAE